MDAQRAVIFVNGELDDPQAALRLVEPGDFLAAADGGLRHLEQLGLIPHLLVGDLDSVVPQAVKRLEAAGVEIKHFPIHKNETDLELALQEVTGRGFLTIRIIAALGGRLDQALGNIALLAHPARKNQDIRLDDGVTEVFFIHSAGSLSGRRGDTVSLLPYGGIVEGVRTEGLEYPLQRERLYPYQTRGISNVMQSVTAQVQIESGRLLCVHIRQKEEGK